MVMTWLWFLILVAVWSGHHNTVHAACSSEPTLPSNGYKLTQSKSSYNTDEKYTIICLPGYSLSGSQDLTCTASGSWSPSSPTCVSNEGKYSWWMLFIGVVAVIILVPCCLPRIIFCCCKKDKDKDKDNDNIKYNGSYNGGGAWRSGKEHPVTPVTDYGKHKLHHLDYYN